MEENTVDTGLRMDDLEFENRFVIRFAAEVKKKLENLEHDVSFRSDLDLTKWRKLGNFWKDLEIPTG